MMEYLNLEENPKSYININDLKSEEDLMKLISEPLEDCQYCINGRDDFDNFPWHPEVYPYNFTKTLQELFLFDYKKYHDLNHNEIVLNYFPLLLKTGKYFKFLGRMNGNDWFKIKPYNNRFFGTLDIIIPFSDKIDNKQINKIKEILKIKNRNINMYFISIKENNINIENQIYNLFRPGDINLSNIFFLKTENITLEEIVNKYTFSKYIYYLPLDNNQNNDYKIIKRKIKKYE